MSVASDGCLGESQRRLFDSLYVQLQLLSKIVEEGADPHRVVSALSHLERSNKALSPERPRSRDLSPSSTHKVHNEQDISTSPASYSPATAVPDEVAILGVAADSVSVETKTMSCGEVVTVDATSVDPPSCGASIFPSPTSKPGFNRRGSSLATCISFDEEEDMDYDDTCPMRGHSVVLHEPGLRRFLQELMMWKGFDVAIGFVITANAATLGIQTSLTTEGKPIPSVIHLLEDIFLVVYLFELMARVVAFGCAVFQSSWIRFDAFLVVCGIADVVAKFAAGPGAQSLLGKLMLTRLLRLARLARVVRLMVTFKVLFMLVQGLVHSLYTLLWTFVIISILLYMFAILGLELIRADESASADYNQVVYDYFRDLPNALLTLLQGLTLDSLGSVYRPIIIEKPYTFFYFMGFILVVSIALMNLVTALMVESSLERTSTDRKAQKKSEAQKKKKMILELEGIFTELDKDGSGMLDMTELTGGPAGARERLDVVLSGSTEDNIEKIFHILDYDASGHLAINEFCEGLIGIQDGKPIEIQSILNSVRDMHHMMRSWHKDSLRCPSTSSIDNSVMQDRLVTPVQEHVYGRRLSGLQAGPVEPEQLYKDMGTSLSGAVRSPDVVTPVQEHVYGRLWDALKVEPVQPVALYEEKDVSVLPSRSLPGKNLCL